MSKIFFLLVAIVALLVATNPSRAEYNDWVEQFAIGKVQRDALARKEQVSWSERMFGGASAGMIVRNIPVSRRNFVLFSIYHLDLPEGFGEADTSPNAPLASPGSLFACMFADDRWLSHLNAARKRLGWGGKLQTCSESHRCA